MGGAGMAGGLWLAAGMEKVSSADLKQAGVTASTAPAAAAASAERFLQKNHARRALRSKDRATAGDTDGGCGFFQMCCV